jgi:lipoprotein-anchoring transpeptidase ErfK/SrfK
MSTMFGQVKNAWFWTGRSARRVFWHKWLLIAAIVLVAAGGGVVAAAYGYDRSQSDVIAKGIRVGSISIGGMTEDAARAKLSRLFKVLERPMKLRWRDGDLKVSGKEGQVRVDIDALVDAALAQSHRGWFIPRAWRELTGGRVQVRLKPRIRYSRTAVQAIVDRVEKRVQTKPIDARLIPSYDRLTIKSGHRGKEVRESLLRWRIKHVLVSRHVSRLIKVPVRRVPPEVTTEALRKQYPSYITIDRGNFTLSVYENLKLVKSYGIAVGQDGLETPAGLYAVQDKQVDPWWHVPNSPWAGDLAGQVIPPGPSDPLKARWLGIFDGAGIHGTDQDWSIGQAVSHGCVRMHIPDVIDLYDRVEVGTPIYIGN